MKVNNFPELPPSPHKAPTTNQHLHITSPLPPPSPRSPEISPKSDRDGGSIHQISHEHHNHHRGRRRAADPPPHPPPLPPLPVDHCRSDHRVHHHHHHQKPPLSPAPLPHRPSPQESLHSWGIWRTMRSRRSNTIDMSQRRSEGLRRRLSGEAGPLSDEGGRRRQAIGLVKLESTRWVPKATRGETRASCAKSATTITPPRP